MFIVVGLMLYCNMQAETNIINWIFWCLNIVNVVFIARADNKESTNRHSRNIAIVLRYTSVFFIIVEVVFIILIGTNPNAH